MIEYDDKIIGYLGMWIVIDQAQITTVAIKNSIEGTD